MRNKISFAPNLASGLLMCTVFSCAGATPDTEMSAEAKQWSAESVAGAEAFMKKVEADLLQLSIAAARASWVKMTYITEDTAFLEAKANEAYMAYVAKRAKEAMRYTHLDLPHALRRKFNLLRLSLSLPAPRNPEKREELAAIISRLDGMYGKGKYCPPRLKGRCLTLGEMSKIMAKRRDNALLLDLWQGWRQVAPPMRDDYARLVTLANEGARELGFANVAELWQSRYDMPPADFATEVDRLWSQVSPLYEQLHCFVRAKLHARYGAVVPADGLIPAHLLGNMWAQDWSNISELLLPQRMRATDLEGALKRRKTTPKQMVRYGERFFTSLGMTKLPETFWQRSMFTRPQDRDVVCHASAWNVDNDQDLRIKMCIEINAEDFETVHHELGHNYYQYYYRELDPLFRDSANDGFHEGLGDTISLSVTPAYLEEIGLVREKATGAIPMLINRALAKVVFLPFGIMIDKWRWDVFGGETSPESYNARWWQLRAKYQGIAPPVDRPDAKYFDPGAKYHIPGNTPYVRYFLAHILQFQFHRALCKIAGHDGPLHTCSIYGNKRAGERLIEMMALGQSRPWPDALEALTGERQFDASAILDYFSPLSEWLKEQNRGRRCGWERPDAA